MTETTYNGWANYETWAVGMYLDGNYTGEGTYREVIELVRSQLSFQHLEGDGIERVRVADYLKDYVGERTEIEEPCLAADLLGCARSRVDWFELADAWIDNVREQVTS